MLIKYLKIVTQFIVLVSISSGYLFQNQVHGQELSRTEMNDLVAETFKITKKEKLSVSPDIEDYFQFALQNNPNIKAAYAKWQGAIEKIVIAKSLPDPRLSFGYFLESIETKVGPQEYKIGLNQMIPWFGKLRLQGDIQALKADAEYQQLQSIINNLYYHVESVVYEAYYLDQSINITEQNINLVQNWEVVVRNKYKTATVSHPALIKTQIERIKLQDDLRTLEDKYKPLIERLRALLNKDTLTAIYTPDTLEFISLEFPREEMERIVMENNPGLLKLSLNQEASNLFIKRAKLDYYPNLGVGIDYIGTGLTSKDPLVGMVSLSFPLWFKKQKAGVDAARYGQRQVEEQVWEKKNQLRVDLETIWFELEDAQRKMELYEQNLIPKSLEALRASEKAYIADKADFINLIDAQRLYLKFLLEHERSLVRYTTAYAKLENIAGRQL